MLAEASIIVSAIVLVKLGGLSYVYVYRREEFDEQSKKVADCLTCGREFYREEEEEEEREDLLNETPTVFVGDEVATPRGTNVVVEPEAPKRKEKAKGKSFKKMFSLKSRKKKDKTL